MIKPNAHGVRAVIIIFLLLCAAFACRMLGKNDVMPLATGYMRNLIFMGLAFAWGCSIQKRIMQKSVRRYLTLIAALLLFWLAERTCKYLFFFEMPTETRYAWYLFYIPMTMAPLLAIFAAACMGEPDSYKLPKKMRLLCVPALAAVAAVLTNDLHQKVFAFAGGVLASGSGKNAYTYGPLYFAVMAWIVLEVCVFLNVLGRKSRIPGKNRRILLPLGMFLLALVYGALYVLEVPGVRYYFGDCTSVFCVIMAVTFEACIYTGLIPSNSRYDELFDVSDIGAILTDTQYRTVLSSETARAFSPETLRAAEESAIMLDDGFRLSGQPIFGGHTFWLEDVSDIANAISQLEDVNDTLEDSTAAKREENESVKRKTRLMELNRMYDKMQLETADQIYLLQKRLAQFAAAEDIQAEKEALGRVMVLGAYIKRRNNLLCILEKQRTTEALDLAYCLNESIEALQIQGVDSGYNMQISGDMDVKTIMRIYDAFEAILEKTAGNLKKIYASVMAEGKDAILVCEISPDTLLSDFAPAGFTLEAEDDGLWLLTYRARAEEGAAV